MGEHIFSVLRRQDSNCAGGIQTECEDCRRGVCQSGSFPTSVSALLHLTQGFGEVPSQDEYRTLHSSFSNRRARLRFKSPKKMLALK